MVESKDNQHLWFCRSWILTHTYIWSCKNEPRPTAMRFVEKMEGIWGTQWTCPTINEDGSKDFSIRPSQTLPASPAHWFYAQQKITKVYSTNVALSSNMSLEHSPHLRRRRLSMIIHLLGFIFRFNDHIYISQPTPPWLLHSVPAPTTTNHHQPPPTANVHLLGPPTVQSGLKEAACWGQSQSGVEGSSVGNDRFTTNTHLQEWRRNFGRLARTGIPHRSSPRGKQRQKGYRLDTLGAVGMVVTTSTYQRLDPHKQHHEPNYQHFQHDQHHFGQPWQVLCPWHGTSVQDKSWETAQHFKECCYVQNRFKKQYTQCLTNTNHGCDLHLPNLQVFYPSSGYLSI